MSEVIKDIFTSDELSVLSELEKNVLQKVQDYPMNLIADKELMGELADE